MARVQFPHFKPSRFTVLTAGFSAPKSSRDFRETGPSSPIMAKHKGDLGYSPFTRENRKFQLETVRTVLTAARVNYRNDLDENAFKLLEMLECTFEMSSGSKDLLFGWPLFQIGQFKLGCGMISDAEKSLKQAEPILMRCHGRNYHLVGYFKKLIGSCALLNNNLEGAFTNLNDADTFFSDINSQHFELANISLNSL